MDLVRVAQQVRELRLEQGLTVSQLAAMSDLSKGFISRLENFRVNPSLNALTRLTKALGISMSDFFNEDSKSPSYIYGSLQDGKEIIRDNSEKFGIKYFSLAYQKLDRVMDPFLIEYRSCNEVREFLMHPNDEFFLLLEGKLDFYIGDDSNHRSIGEGDSVYLTCNLPHKVKLCEGVDFAKALVVYCKPFGNSD
jgi:transcriptional regulator with XRE-family HTH domain